MSTEYTSQCRLCAGTGWLDTENCYGCHGKGIVIHPDWYGYVVEEAPAPADKVEREIDNYKMLLEEANRQIATLKELDGLNTDIIASMTDQLDNSLPKDKVRELLWMIDQWVDASINLYSEDHYRITPDEFRQRAEELGRVRSSIVDRRKALFPEGVEKK